jgi:hypothetical protein
LLRDRRGQFVELKHVGSSGLMESAIGMSAHYHVFNVETQKIPRADIK